MAEQFADDVQVTAAHDEFGGKGMSQIMPTEVRDTCFLQNGPPGRIDIVEATAVARLEHEYVS